MSNLINNDTVQIREVWDHNLEEEIGLISNIVDDFPYLAFDTEFPGVVVLYGSNYQKIKNNVNVLKLIQLGLTFCDENGKLPTCGTDKFCVWQFNFREFSPEKDQHFPASIDLLQRSGIDFQKNSQMGVDSVKFSELMTPLGILLNDSIHWIVFDGGYDLGYMLKMLTGKLLPDKQSEFFSTMVKVYFPSFYDVKHMVKFCDNAGDLHGGLSTIARKLDVERIGSSHQAGSDSLLTCRVFLKLKEKFADGITSFNGKLNGLDADEVDTQ